MLNQILMWIFIGFGIVIAWKFFKNSAKLVGVILVAAVLYFVYSKYLA